MDYLAKLIAEKIKSLVFDFSPATFPHVFKSAIIVKFFIRVLRDLFDVPLIWIPIATICLYKFFSICSKERNAQQIKVLLIDLIGLSLTGLFVIVGALVFIALPPGGATLIGIGAGIWGTYKHLRNRASAGMNHDIEIISSLFQETQEEAKKEFSKFKKSA